VGRLTEDEQYDLMIRLDERSCNIYHLLEKVEMHQREQNGNIAKNTGWRRITVPLFFTLLAFILGWLALIQTAI